MSLQTSTDTLVTVFGGSGFLGRHLVRALARRRYRIRVAVRPPDHPGHQHPRGAGGQIEAVQANVRYPASVEAAVRGSSVVVNLVAILYERGAQHFEVVHTLGSERVALAAAAHGARVIHVSAIGADENSRSAYARTKAQGEKLVLAAEPGATIFRPSVLFGPEDDFFNRFASLARFTPVLPLIGGGRTKFQPAYAADVAEAIALAVDGRTKAGTTYELGGPEVRTFRQLMEYVLATTGRKRLLVPVPFLLARLQAAVLQFLPNPPLTPDQVELLRYDNIVSEEAARERRTFEGLGIAPTTIEAVAPSYLWRFRKAGQFQTGPA